MRQPHRFTSEEAQRASAKSLLVPRVLTPECVLNKSLRTLFALMHTKNPPNMRIAAAKAVLTIMYGDVPIKPANAPSIEAGLKLLRRSDAPKSDGADAESDADPERHSVSSDGPQQASNVGHGPAPLNAAEMAPSDSSNVRVNEALSRLAERRQREANRG